MGQQLTFKPRKKHRNPKATRKVRAAFDSAAAAGAGGAQIEFPGLESHEGEDTRRTWITGGASAAFHLGILLLLFYFASLAPEIEEIIPVTLLPDRPEPAEAEPAPAPKVLAERRFANFAPSVQSVAPQVINPRVIAAAAPAVQADTLQMDSVSSVRAPRQISRSNAPVVERVGVVSSPIAARASTVDVQGVGGPAVRGPIKVQGPVGPSVGPRQVAMAKGAPTMGTGTLSVGSGSSVREGRITGRDVVGSPTGQPLVSINTTVGEGLLRGPGGGSGTGMMSETAGQCLGKPSVKRYLDDVQTKTLDRWILPPGIDADQNVTLRFQLDVAGSATSVSLVKASNNALGASAVDALRSAAPFPPMPDDARCLARVPITATFSNPVASS
jgi:TonB family protein